MSVLEDINSVLVAARGQLDAADNDCARAIQLADDAAVNAAAIGFQDTIAQLDSLKSQIAQARHTIDAAKIAADTAAATAVQIAQGL